MVIDIHAKTRHSRDVSLSVEQVLDRAAEQGLDGVVFCETLSSTGATRAVEAGHQRDIKVFVGVEIPTDRGILIGIPPRVDNFLLEERWRRHTELVTPSVHDILGMFHEQKAAVIAARPYDLEIPFNMGDHLFDLDRVDAVEVFNSRVGRVQNDFALEAARVMGTSTVGGSDPTGDDTGSIGRFATFLSEDVEDQAALVSMIREGELWAVMLGEDQMPTSNRKGSGSARRSSRRDSRRSSRGNKGGRGGSQRSSRDGGRGRRGR